MRNMIPSRKEKGFTLIELVMVIVILGILAAFALPRFADLTGDAEQASIAGARGSVQSAIGIVRSAALAAGETDTTGTDLVTLEGVGIDLANGYLAGSSLEDAAQLGDYEVLASNTIVALEDEDGSPCFSFTESTVPAGASAAVPSSVGPIASLNTTPDPSTCN